MWFGKLASAPQILYRAWSWQKISVIRCEKATSYNCTVCGRIHLKTLVRPLKTLAIFSLIYSTTYRQQDMTGLPRGGFV